MSKGFIYALINPTMEGYVKIGRTNKDPNERAKEISNATGVAQPFILVYQKQFNNYIDAEKYIHNFLQEKGYRVSNNREFFQLPIHEAIDIINYIYNEINEKLGESVFDEDNTEEKELGESLYEEGSKYLYGIDDYLEDVEKALVLYEQASELGFGLADIGLGLIYSSGYSNKKADKRRAINYYKAAISKGEIRGYYKLAKVYGASNKQLYNSGADDQYYHQDNAYKCWNLYFDKLLEANTVDATALKEYIQFNKVSRNEKRYCWLIKKFTADIEEAIRADNWVRDVNDLLNYLRELSSYQE